jgi:hypothetical protein
MAGVVLAFICSGAIAFPDRPLTLVVPYHATGTSDINGVPRMTKLVKLVQTLSTPSLTDALAQEVASGLSAALEQTVRVERIAGGMTVEGVQRVSRAVPDGHTLLFAGNQTIAINPLLMRQHNHDPQRNLVPVAEIAGMPIALIGERESPVHTIRQVIERVRSTPGRVGFASLGDTTTAYLAAEEFQRRMGLHFLHVNFNGSTPALNALATRNVEFGFVPLNAVLPFVGGGKVRVIAITSSRRHAALPDVPTIAESGLADYSISGWFGIFAPAATPAAIIALLNREICRVIAEDGWQRSLVARGLLPANSSAEAFRMLIARDSRRWAGLIDPETVH